VRNQTLVREEKEIGLDHVEIRQDDVERRSEHATDGALAKIAPDHSEKIAGNRLVLPDRRRRHVVLSVDQLVPHPVVREVHVVVVGELHVSIAPRHAPILVTLDAS
jgi:hypothetical protein